MSDPLNPQQTTLLECEPVQLPQRSDPQNPHFSDGQEEDKTPNPNSPKSDSEKTLNPEPQTAADPELEEDDEEEGNEDDEEELEEEEEEEGEGQDQELQETPVTSYSSGMPLDDVVSQVTAPHATPSVNPAPTPRSGAHKRKKGKGRPSFKKQQAIDEKLRSLMSKLKPIPFIPHKILDFVKHEGLLRRLGLWDFVNIDFDRDIRVDLVAQLVATYEAKARAGHVNGARIRVNRADLARAFKFPLKKEKGGGGGGGEVEVNWEAMSEESIGFMVEFVSDWVLLHEDMWLMPNEVMNWIKLIRDGHPEKVDWAGMVWFMVEKELTQGGQLRDCYYASHLQYLIKSQREELFFVGKANAETVELSAESKEEVEKEQEEVNEENVKVGDDGVVEEEDFVGGPSTELTLGQDAEKEEEVKEEDMMDLEKYNGSDEDQGGDDAQGNWLSHGKDNLGEHFMQRCSAAENDDGAFGSFGRDDEMEEGGDEEEAGDDDGVHVFPNDDGDDDDALQGHNGLTGNLLQAMEANQVAFTSEDQQQMHDPVSIDMGPTSSLFNHSGKRMMDHDNGISHHAVLNDSNKRLRINDSWNYNKPVDFISCMEQIQQMSERARIFYEEKEHTLEQTNMNQQILLNELQKRDNVIEHLHKSRVEEIQKKDAQIYRLERELYLMGSVLDGYRKALKETQKVFAEYREKAQLKEESVYKDAGPGGLMLSTGDLEKLRKKKEEEFKVNCLTIENKMKKAEEDYVGQFESYVEKIKDLDMKLTRLEGDAKELIGLYKRQDKNQETEEKVPEVGEEPQPTPQTEEKMVSEAGEDPQPTPQTEEKMVSEVGEDPQPTLQTEEKMVTEAAAESLPDE